MILILMMAVTILLLPILVAAAATAAAENAAAAAAGNDSGTSRRGTHRAAVVVVVVVGLDLPAANEEEEDGVTVGQIIMDRDERIDRSSSSSLPLLKAAAVVGRRLPLPPLLLPEAAHSGQLFKMLLLMLHEACPRPRRL